ncbi:putative serine incorporator [Micractinium conductrix]|uniref:Serine incorporator n=1 Tax=Micractinium conductrix TaxID=554055 RepID=A0A2P6VAG3_9CHLO|nr:putative serine incorporator [Micractinium conductrix]|eukprot:PSC71077.1 putative serine incorporator [Micractinium conductrix]
MACCGICAVPVAWAQWLYFICFIAVTCVSWVLRDYGAQWLDISPLNKCLEETSPPNPSCMGQEAVLRMAFGTFMFFALLLLLTLGVTSKSSKRLPLHTGFWPLKILLWGGLIGSTFAMNNDVLDGFGQAARVFSGFFIVLQLVIILDFIYVVNAWLVERRSCAFPLVAVTLLLICGSFVGIGFLFHHYAPQGSCSLNIWFITSIILLFLLYGFISVSPIRHESAGLFTSACVFAHTTYYVWSALNSEPRGDACTPDGTNNSAITIIGFVVAMVALGFSTMSSGTSSGAFDLEKDSDIDDDKLAYRPDFFHGMFMLASCYMMMLLVGWDLEGQAGEFTLDAGWASTWVKIAAAWLCGLLYVWSLIAHRVLKNRQF